MSEKTSVEVEKREIPELISKSLPLLNDLNDIICDLETRLDNFMQSPSPQNEDSKMCERKTVAGGMIYDINTNIVLLKEKVINILDRLEV